MPPFQPRTVTLKTGETAIIRLMAEADLLDVYNLEKALHVDGRGVVLGVDELDATLEEFRESQQVWLTGARSGDGGARIVVEVGGHAVASGEVHRLRPSYLRHVAVLAMGVHPAFQGRGVGRVVVMGILEWARSGPAAGEIRRIELYMRSDNERARALYESAGFVAECVRKDFVCLPGGDTVDDVIMVQFLDSSSDAR
jgi:RimJ/RimL family protein N-acetyltransferase